MTEGRQAPWKVLAHLAKPVLLGTQSRDKWENDSAPSVHLPQARMSLWGIMERFFKGVFDFWELPHDRPYRRHAIIAVASFGSRMLAGIAFFTDHGASLANGEG